MTSGLSLASAAFGNASAGGLGGNAAYLDPLGMAAGAGVGSASGVNPWIARMAKYGPYASMLASLGSGFAAQNAYNQEAMYAQRAAEFEAAQLEVNAQIAAEEAARDADKIARSGREFMAEQAVAYASSGVTLEGSPLLVLDDTRRKAQEEVDATYRRGQQIASAMKTQAQITREFGQFKSTASQNRGRSALVGAVNSGFSNLFNNYVNRQRQGVQASNFAGRLAAYAPATWAGGTP